MYEVGSLSYDRCRMEPLTDVPLSFTPVALYLDDNLLSGIIPDTLAALTSMIDLRLGGNSFDQSTFPSFVLDFTDLQVLRLQQCNFTGPVPVALSNLVNLRQLWLDDNALTGATPDLSAATELTILRLPNNQFTGQVPTYLESLGQLVDIRLGNNLLTGVIPEFIGNMVQLQLFACQGNQLTGGLPETLTNLVNLGELRCASSTAFMNNGDIF